MRMRETCSRSPLAKRVIVTGASSGIGRATALELAKNGCEVVLAARRLPLLVELTHEIEAAGGVAHPVPCDITSAKACQDLIDAARRLGEGYPVLVNAAGVAEFGPFDEVEAAALTAQIEVNLLGALYCCHAAIPWMLEEGGQIINVLSIAATHVFPGAAGYAVGKAGLHMLGKVLQAEYRSRGLRITNLIPGSVDTPLWEGQSFAPPKEDMMPPEAVAQAIRDLVNLPTDRNVDELVLMPPKGIL